MKEPKKIPLVTTIKERCRVCYTCVRECPAKAIRITGGQADVLSVRCIGCGNCVQVCGQGAKSVYDSTGAAKALLKSGDKVAAIVAPSFPAAFRELAPEQVVGLIRGLGFPLVAGVAFGADLVAASYKNLLDAQPDKRYIATTCPAVVAYVQRFYPMLVDALAPIVSPMGAAARVLKAMHGDDLKVVFIGPCIAKKEEAAARVRDDVHTVLTFAELRRMAEEKGLSPDTTPPADFDPPHGGLGALFPISRGLLQSAGLTEDLVSSEIIVTEGRRDFVEALKEFHAGHCRPRLLEVLACQGCIMGPGIPNTDPLFRRRGRISQYVGSRMARHDESAWRAALERFLTLDLSQTFAPDDQRLPDPSQEQLRAIMEHMGKHGRDDELNCGACGYETCREHAVAIYNGLAESEMCLPFMIDRLRETVRSLALSKEKLAQTQETLMHAEKLANMGQLAAGIAHELNNPLGVILMYAHMLIEDHKLENEAAEDLIMLATQADRCKNIVGGLLHFARQHKTKPALVDVRRVIEEAVKLAPIPASVHVEMRHEGKSYYAQLDRDQMLQVLINLINNACHAMPDGGTLTLGSGGDEEELRLYVKDTGIGISKENLKRVFEPFFTTKEIGKGTGMGLAISYGIIKMHRGNMTVESNAEPERGPTGTCFTVTLRRRPNSGEEGGDGLEQTMSGAVLPSGM